MVEMEKHMKSGISNYFKAAILGLIVGYFVFLFTVIIWGLASDGINSGFYYTYAALGFFTSLIIGYKCFYSPSEGIISGVLFVFPSWIIILEHGLFWVVLTIFPILGGCIGSYLFYRYKKSIKISYHLSSVTLSMGIIGGASIMIFGLMIGGFGFFTGLFIIILSILYGVKIRKEGKWLSWKDNPDIIKIFCPNCGVGIEGRDIPKYCPKCGKEIWVIKNR